MFWRLVSLIVFSFLFLTYLKEFFDVGLILYRSSFGGVITGVFLTIMFILSLGMVYEKYKEKSIEVIDFSDLVENKKFQIRNIYLKKHGETNKNQQVILEIEIGGKFQLVFYNQVDKINPFEPYFFKHRGKLCPVIKDTLT